MKRPNENNYKLSNYDELYAYNVECEKYIDYLESNSRWINAEDEPPEVGKLVISFEPHCLTNEDKGMTITVTDNSFNDRKSDGTLWITHYMLAPSPPKLKKIINKNARKKC